MELKQLVAVVTVAELGSVTAAARVLHLVQPAVSRQIRMLEEELGVSLFERSRIGMTPSAVGLEFIERAKRALADIDRAEALARRDGAALAGAVTVGLLESVVGQLAIPLAQAVRVAYPRIELQILSGFSGHLAGWLSSGDVDMSLLYSLTGNRGELATPLVVESLWAVGPPDSGLDLRTAVSWSRVCEQDLVLPAPGHGLRTLIDFALAEACETPRVMLETNSMDVQKGLVRSHRAWTILPAIGVARDVAMGELAAAPVTGPPITRTVALALARARSSPAVEAVAHEVVATVARLVTQGDWPGRLVGSV